MRGGDGVRRRLLQAFLALSAALCGWSLCAWVRSYWPEDVALRSYRGRLVVLATGGVFTKYNEKGAEEYRFAPRVWRDFHRMAQSQWQAIGFSYAAADFPTGAYRLLAIPFPFIVLPTAAGPVWWAWHTRLLRRRRREGRCAGCGYDLRESRGRCPECGIEGRPGGRSDPSGEGGLANAKTE
jgi:hypothetical protein